MRVYKNLCPATISASIMAASMWEKSLKNVESDNNKILYETSLDSFYSETVFTFSISLVNFYVTQEVYRLNNLRIKYKVLIRLKQFDSYR